MQKGKPKESKRAAAPGLSLQEWHTLDDVRAMYETMRQRQLIAEETFGQNLTRVWLSAGFRQETDPQGVEWLIKP